MRHEKTHLFKDSINLKQIGAVIRRKMVLEPLMGWVRHGNGLGTTNGTGNPTTMNSTCPNHNLPYRWVVPRMQCRHRSWLRHQFPDSSTGRTSSHWVLWILHSHVHYFQHLNLLTSSGRIVTESDSACNATGVGRLFLGVGAGVER